MEILLYGEEGFDKVTLLRAHLFLLLSIPHLLLRLKVSVPGIVGVTIEVIVVHGELREMIHDVSGRRSVGLWGECCKSPSRSSRGGSHRPAFGWLGFFPPTCIPQPFE
jgi:hypothetical protein